MYSCFSLVVMADLSKVAIITILQTSIFLLGKPTRTESSQDLWQEWLAKIGHVQKTLLILDTCESGAAAGLIRGVSSARQTAMDQLQHATGQNLIAATGGTQSAIEGYKGHGVLTYALLDAMTKKNENSRDESVKVGMLADYVDEHVPAITQSVWGVFQKPVRKLSGNDFPIGIRQPVLVASSEGPEIPKEPTHVLIRAELIREKPSVDAPGARQIVAGTQVRAVEFTGPWVIIARDGQKLGYVPVDALARLQ